MLLFGGSRLPQLAKALGQSKRAFKEGIADFEAEGRVEQSPPGPAAEHNSALSAVDDEVLFEEARRRAHLSVAETNRLEEVKLLTAKQTVENPR
jgi:Sec-independent protein translocase protein TatA